MGNCDEVEGFDAAERFIAAAEWVQSIVELIPDHSWDSPGLGEWDLRGLAGHTSRALSTVGVSVGRPALAEDLPRPVDYFLRVFELPGATPEFIRDRGVAAGLELGPNPALAFAEVVERAISEVRSADNPLITTLLGGMYLQTYLPTRTFEIVIHGLDICTAIGVTSAPPAAALRETLGLIAEIAVLTGRGEELALAATGRQMLSPGFTVLQAPNGEVLPSS